MYGSGSRLRYFIGFALAIILLIFVIVLIVGHGGGKSKLPTTKRTLVSLTTDDNAAVRETIDGQTNAAQDHNELRITVTNANTTAELMKGYDGHVTNTKMYPMSTTSFNVFLSALDHAGFTKGSTKGKLDDPRGYCPSGNRYVFEVMENGKDVERFWSTSCGNPKTFEGNTNVVLSLFQAQVPDYEDLVSAAQNSNTASSNQ